MKVTKDENKWAPNDRKSELVEELKTHLDKLSDMCIAITGESVCSPNMLIQIACERRPDLAGVVIEEFGSIEYVKGQLYELRRNRILQEEEDKQSIANALAETLKLTRRFNNVERIDITKVSSMSEGHNGEVQHWCDEYAEVYINHNKVPYRRVNVTADSGIAMIQDIIKELYK